MSLADNRDSNWVGNVLARCGERSGGVGSALTPCGLLDGAGRLRLTGALELCRFFSISGRFLKTAWNFCQFYLGQAVLIQHNIHLGSGSIDPPPDSS